MCLLLHGYMLVRDGARATHPSFRIAVFVVSYMNCPTVCFVPAWTSVISSSVVWFVICLARYSFALLCGLFILNGYAVVCCAIV